MVKLSDEQKVSVACVIAFVIVTIIVFYVTDNPVQHWVNGILGI